MATRFQRAQWNPIVPIVVLALEIMLLALAGPLRIAAVVVTGVWSAIALYNWRTGGRLIDSLYD